MLKGVENIFNVDLLALAGAVVYHMIAEITRMHLDALDREDRSHGGHAHLSVFRGCERHHVPMKKERKKREFGRPTRKYSEINAPYESLSYPAINIFGDKIHLSGEIDVEQLFLAIKIYKISRSFKEQDNLK